MFVHHVYIHNTCSIIVELSRQEIIDQGMLFMVAGFDTTSSTISTIIYCLALNPDIQNKTYVEIKNENGDIDEEAVNKFKYLEAVILESIRFLPAVPR